jgi:hypothetical protein
MDLGRLSGGCFLAATFFLCQAQFVVCKYLLGFFDTELLNPGITIFKALFTYLAEWTVVRVPLIIRAGN